jgi:hypothetical protein
MEIKSKDLFFYLTPSIVMIYAYVGIEKRMSLFGPILFRSSANFSINASVRI